MSQHNFRLYRFRECLTEFPLPFGEDSLTIAQALTTFPQSILTYNATTMDTVNSTNSNTTVNNTLNESSDVIPSWIPSPRLRNLHTRFQTPFFFNTSAYLVLSVLNYFILLKQNGLIMILTILILLKYIEQMTDYL